MAMNQIVRRSVIGIVSLTVVGAAMAQPARNAGRPGGGPHGTQSSQSGQGHRSQMGPTTRPGGGATTRPSADQLFDRLDTNHDGVLSRDEFKAFLSHLPPPPPPKDE